MIIREVLEVELDEITVDVHCQYDTQWEDSKFTKVEFEGKEYKPTQKEIDVINDALTEWEYTAVEDYESAKDDVIFDD
jgi:hypothetical protein